VRGLANKLINEIKWQLANDMHTVRCEKNETKVLSTFVRCRKTHLTVHDKTPNECSELLLELANYRLIKHIILSYE